MILAPGQYHCLSIWQPWAWAIFNAGKGIENRSWPAAYRGKLLIHAAKNISDLARVCHLLQVEHQITPPDDLVFGAIVGMVELNDCDSTLPTLTPSDRREIGAVIARSLKTL